MAGSSKKPRNIPKPENGADAQSDDSEEFMEEEIQATFEGRNPEPHDFHGIKQLLHQLFVTAHLDLSELTDLTLAHNGIGSVLKQSVNDSDDEDDIEMVEESDVFGITTAINLTQYKDRVCVQQLHQLIETESKKNADEATYTAIKTILENKKVGLILNERFINIPSKISAPMLESLQSEITRAKRKNKSYDFDYYLMFIKLWEPKDDTAAETVFSNEEEELFYKMADFSFDYTVPNKSDTGVSGTWQADDPEMIPCRAVILFKSDKIVEALTQLALVLA